MNLKISNEELRALIPNVIHEVEGEALLVDKLTPWLESAMGWLETEYLGPDDFLSQSHKEFARKIIVYKAFADAIPSLDVTLSPAGFAVISTDGRAPASKERIERLINSLRDYVRVNVNLLLEVCHSYEVWRLAERGQYFCASFISSPKDCEDANLNISFVEARRRAILFESAIAERYIGSETMNSIRNDFNCRVIKQGNPLVDLIRSIIVNVIAQDNFVIDQNRLWHASRRILNELNYYPKYKTLWDDEMGEKFMVEPFKNNVKGGFFF